MTIQPFLATKISAFLVFLALPVILGSASAYHTRKYAPKEYPKLKKPLWAPPTSLIKPLWFVLYLLMGVSSYLVWRQKIINNVPVKAPLGLYVLQLVFNVLWSPIFFRVKSHLLGLVVIFLNLVTAVLTALSFAPISPTAYKLMLPYITVLFLLGYLNKRVWRMNQVKKKKKSKKVVDSDNSDSE